MSNFEMSNFKGSICPVCSDIAEVLVEPNPSYDFVTCKSCGRFKIHTLSNKNLNNNELASYLYYNGLIDHPFYQKNERFFNFIGEKKIFDEDYIKYPYCYYVSKNTIDNWYPKTFSEKIDIILLGLAKNNKYEGSYIVLSTSQKLSAFFIKRYNEDGSVTTDYDRNMQFDFFASTLENSDLIENSTLGFKIKSKGLERIDLLQRNNSSSNTVFLAMSFSPEMKEVREAIRSAIEAAGYIPRIMDEIEHNHQIIPEMLYEIKQSKFTVAELTGHNNGAYFEAGYALGLGKEVIQICRKDAFGEDGHFDVKQVNTILWETIDYLKYALINRIKATIS